MTERALRPVIAIVGPTASGKSAVGDILAERLGGEVVSADSMQVYRGMDIGTGKLPVSKRSVSYHGLDLVDPGEPYSASLFQAYARDAFSAIVARGSVPFLVGGTGFYVRAALDAYEFPAGDQSDNPVREAAMAYAAEQGALALWERLRERDQRSAAAIHPNNARRVARAFEMLADGTSYADQRERLSSIPQAVPALFYGLSVPRETLYERINDRVDSMIDDGLVEEVERLLEKGFRSGITAPQAIGYKEIVRALDGACSLSEAVEDIKRATRRYAKRQCTWFGRDARITWLDAKDGNAERIAEAIWFDDNFSKNFREQKVW